MKSLRFTMSPSRIVNAQAASTPLSNRNTASESWERTLQQRAATMAENPNPASPVIATGKYAYGVVLSKLSLSRSRQHYSIESELLEQAEVFELTIQIF
jgi:hypothetical protein